MPRFRRSVLCFTYYRSLSAADGCVWDRGVFLRVVMFFLVGKVIKLLGHIGVMYLGLLGYTVRFCILPPSFQNSWVGWLAGLEVYQGLRFQGSAVSTNGVGKFGTNNIQANSLFQKPGLPGIPFYQDCFSL